MSDEKKVETTVLEIPPMVIRLGKDVPIPEPQPQTTEVDILEEEDGPGNDSV
jgi:hypothetical protein